MESFFLFLILVMLFMLVLTLQKAADNLVDSLDEIGEKLERIADTLSVKDKEKPKQ